MLVKKVCLPIALFTLCFGTFAQSSEDGCYQCGVSLRGRAADTSEMEDLSISILANQICDAMNVYQMTGVGVAHEAFEMMILDHLNIDKANNPNYRVEVRNFWNANHERMICTNETPGHTSPQHILKRVIEMQSTSTFYFQYFLEDRRVNVNAIEMREGQPETVVDYIDTILADPQAENLYDVSELRRLRSFLLQFMNAKRASEILNA